MLSWLVSFFERRPCLGLSFPWKRRSIFVELLKEGLRPIQILVATTLVSQSLLVSGRLKRIQRGQKFALLDWGYFSLSAWLSSEFRMASFFTLNLNESSAMFETTPSTLSSTEPVRTLISPSCRSQLLLRSLFDCHSLTLKPPFSSTMSIPVVSSWASCTVWTESSISSM